MKVDGKIVLVTGGAGFIGSHIVDRLTNEGAHVRILDNLSTGDAKNITASRNVQFLKGDIRDKADVKKALRDVDLVFHEAAQINPARAVEDPFFDFEVNALGTMNLLLESINAKVSKFIMASTNTYGDANVEVMSENFSTLFEKRSLLSPYAAAKVCAEAYLKTANDELGLPTVRLRYFNVYGPRQLTKSESGAVAIFCRQALLGKEIVIFGDGSHTRDFVYVSDVVEANILAAETEQANGGVFNVGSGRETSILELARIITEIVGKQVPISYGPARAADFRRARADLKRSEQILGFHPKVELREGLRAYISWLSEHINQEEHKTIDVSTAQK